MCKTVTWIVIIIKWNWKKKKKKKKKILNNLSPRGFDWLKMQTMKRLQPDRVSMTAFSER